MPYRQVVPVHRQRFRGILSHRSLAPASLELAQGNVEKKQTQSQNHADSPINFGDLGNFCEKVFDRHATGDRGYVLYNITDCTQEELLHYLQDSFEIPYWQLMLYLFLQQNVNSRSLSGTVVFRVLSRLKIEILHKRDVKPLMRGIDARIAVLEDVWHKDTSAFEASELFQAPFRTPDSDQSCSSPNEEPAMPVKAFPTWPKDQQSNPKVNRTTMVATIEQELTFVAIRTPSSSSP